MQHKYIDATEQMLNLYEYTRSKAKEISKKDYDVFQEKYSDCNKKTLKKRYRYYKEQQDTYFKKYLAMIRYRRLVSLFLLIEILLLLAWVCRILPYNTLGVGFIMVFGVLVILFNKIIKLEKKTDYIDSKALINILNTKEISKELYEISLGIRDNNSLISIKRIIKFSGCSQIVTIILAIITAVITGDLLKNENLVSLRQVISKFLIEIVAPKEYLIFIDVVFLIVILAMVNVLYKHFLDTKYYKLNKITWLINNTYITTQTYNVLSSANEKLYSNLPYSILLDMEMKYDIDKSID